MPPGFHSNIYLHASLFVLGLLFNLDAAQADVRVASIFGDNMVIQRETIVPIWGWSDPGDAVTVKARDQEITTKTDIQGKWIARLQPLKVGEPFTMTVTGPRNTVNIRNVVVGEVWICSGQSNMAWTVNASGNPDEERANADFPMIRHVTISRQIGTKPRDDIENSGWHICSPDTVGDFTAVGYYFGRKLHRELDVPVGLINTSWGGTIVEAWTSGESLSTHPDFVDRIQDIKAMETNLDTARKTFDAEMESWKQQLDAAKQKSDSLAAVDLDDSAWNELNAPGQWEGQGFARFDGLAWYRKSIEVPESWIGKELSLSLSRIDDDDRTFVNGKLIGQTIGWNKQRNYKISSAINDGGELNIAVQVSDTGGEGGFRGEREQMSVGIGEDNNISLAGKWRFKTEDIESELPPKPKPPGFNGPNNPTALFNSMINPLVPFSIRGAIWYQGESNASRAYQYRELFPLLIKDWRTKWNQELPFYWVQLANFRSAVDAPQASDWAELREAQSMALSLPATGEAVIIDIGEARDIHPKNKQDVGRRLALIALNKNYNQDVVFSGPRYRSMNRQENKIRLSFEYADGLRTSDGQPLSQFAIAGADQKFVWANAEIDGCDVIVSSAEIENPVAVRYAWANNPAGCNLANASGLPASPFRTDNWPGLTVEKK